MAKQSNSVIKWVLGVIAVCGLTLGIVYVSGGMQMLTAPFRGEVEAEERVQGGDFRIAAYEAFYDQCASVQADEDRINNLEDERENAEGQRVSQLDTTITAVKNSRAEKIREYNADSQKEATRGQFRDSGLPFELDVDAEETVCSL